MTYQKMTDNKDGMPRPELDAAREGRTFYKWVNDQAAINAAVTVLTDAGLLMAIADGYRYVITSFMIHLTTVSDTVAMDFVTTVGADGSGIATAVSPHFHLATGAALAEDTPYIAHLNPPIVLTHKDGCHAFTARGQTNDAGAAVTVGYSGWYETED